MAMVLPRGLTKDQEQRAEVVFGVLLANTELFPEVLGANVEDPCAFTRCYSNVTSVVLTSGYGKSAEFVAPADVSRHVIYQRSAQVSKSALGSLCATQSRTNEAISELRRKVETFGSLPANWDREGAEPVSAETVNTALQVVEHIAIVLERKNTISAPSVRPFPDGSIFFKWIRGQKELAMTVKDRDVEAQRWQPLDAFHSQGLWEISVDATLEHVEWLLT